MGRALPYTQPIQILFPREPSRGILECGTTMRIAHKSKAKKDGQASKIKGSLESQLDFPVASEISLE